MVDFWDVGQGDCSVIRLPDDSLIVIDVGPASSPLVDWLDANPRLIRAIILTHNDQDHAGSMEALLGNHESNIKRIYMIEDCKVKTEKFMRLFARVRDGHKRGAYRLLGLYQDSEIWSDHDLGVRLTVRYPDFAAQVERPTANLTSGILSLKIKGGDEILWAADNSLENVVAHCDPRPVLLGGPHHGAPVDSTSDKIKYFTEQLEPHNCFISVGTNNRDTHPRARYIKALTRTRCKVSCSQLTKQCDLGRVRNEDPVMESHFLLGLRAPRKGVSCRGPLRFSLRGTSFVPDAFNEEHSKRVAKLTSPLCR